MAEQALLLFPPVAPENEPRLNAWVANMVCYTNNHPGPMRSHASEQMCILAHDPAATGNSRAPSGSVRSPRQVSRGEEHDDCCHERHEEVHDDLHSVTTSTPPHNHDLRNVLKGRHGEDAYVRIENRQEGHRRASEEADHEEPVYPTTGRGALHD